MLKKLVSYRVVSTIYSALPTDVWASTRKQGRPRRRWIDRWR